MLLISSTQTTDDKHNVWYLDSGTSTHMTCQCKWLSSFNPKCPTHSVILGNNATLAVHGSRQIQATTLTHNHSVTITLKGVLYIPNLAKNLLSMSRLIQLGYTILLDRNSAVICHPQASLPPLVTWTECNMLIVDLSPFSHQALTTHIHMHGPHSLITLDHLHLCMGHISTAQLKLAATATTNITLAPGSELSSCNTCIKAKQHHKTISISPTPRSDTPMHLIHSNICGPFPTHSFTGHLYFVSFIDDYTQHATIYFLKEKSKTLNCLHDYVASMPTSTQVCVLWSNNGSKYTGHNTQAFLRASSIEHTPSPLYTPQYNGVAEWFNHTIVKMVRAMLFSSSLPCSFWAEAIATAVHIHNHSPMHANNDCSPHEVLHSDPPTLSHLHPFSARAHLLQPKHKHDKLDPHGVEAQYLRPTHNQTTHQMWIPSSHTTTMSCNVTLSHVCQQRLLTT